MFEFIPHHEFLFAIVLLIVFIAIYYYYLDIDYKFLFALSTYYYVIIPLIIIPFDTYNNQALQTMNARLLIQQYSIFLVFSICCSIFLFIGAKSFKGKKSPIIFAIVRNYFI